MAQILFPMSHTYMDTHIYKYTIHICTSQTDTHINVHTGSYTHTLIHGQTDREINIHIHTHLYKPHTNTNIT